MTNSLKDRLAAGEVCIGGWLTVPVPAVTEAMATCGFHWMALDMEHSPADVDRAQTAFMVIERHGVASLARLPEADPILARRLLDAGAQGLIVPVVEDAAVFANFTRHCVYPPTGRRGVGLVRANRWGDEFNRYFEDFSPVLVPQIETRRGVEAVDAIAAMAEVDALFLGPYDLSADLGCPGDFTSPEFAEAISKVKAACQRHGKAAGIHQVSPDMDALYQRLDEGYRFVAFGTDLIAMRHAFAGVKEWSSRR